VVGRGDPLAEPEGPAAVPGPGPPTAGSADAAADALARLYEGLAEVSDRLLPVLSSRAEHGRVRQARLLRRVSHCPQRGAEPAGRAGQKTAKLAATAGGAASVGAVAETGAVAAGAIAGPSRGSERPVESRVRENLTHGSERGRGKHDLA